jgi:hypothetical protein
MSRAGDIPYSPNDDFDRSREFPKLTALAIARVRAEHSSKSDDSHSPAAPPQGPVAGVSNDNPLLIGADLNSALLRTCPRVFWLF